MIQCWDIPSIPDRTRACYTELAYPAPVLAAVGDAHESVLRGVASFGPVLTFGFRFAYDPAPEDSLPWSRLAPHVYAASDNREVGTAASALIERGALAPYFRFRRCEYPDVPWRHFRAAAHISRASECIVPAISHTRNDMLPEFFCIVHPYEPKREPNDQLRLDAVLDPLTEHVLVDIAVTPTDATAELRELSLYCSKLDEMDGRYLPYDPSAKLDPIVDETGRTVRTVMPFRDRPPLAQRARRDMQRLADESLRHPGQLEYHVVVLAETLATARLVATTVAESSFRDGSYSLFAHTDPHVIERVRALLQSGRVLPPGIHPPVVAHTGPGLRSSLSRLPHLAPVPELSVFRLPVGASYPCHCLSKETDAEAVEIQDGIPLGTNIWGERRGNGVVHAPLVVLPKRDLPTHVFITGKSGYGKSNCVTNIILNLSRLRIPFLLVEPVKSEYRALKRLARHPDAVLRALGERLEVYTPGNEQVSPFRLNPLEPVAGTSLEEHLDARLACLAAALPMEGSLPSIIREALQEAFREHALPPTLRRLITCVSRVVSKRRYSAGTGPDMEAAAKGRLSSLTMGTLGRTFQCPVTVPSVVHLLETPTVLELERLPPEGKCVFMLFLLTAIREALRAHALSDGRVVYAIVLEEAHRIFGMTGDARPSALNPDPQAALTQYITWMLCELRSLGAALLLCDQGPCQLSPAVVRHTSSMITFCVSASEEKERVADAMCFDSVAYDDLCRLAPGEAFFFSPGRYRPTKLRTFDLREGQQGLDLSPVPDPELLDAISREPWAADARARRYAAELDEFHSAIDELDGVLSALRRAAVSLFRRRPEALRCPSATMRHQLLQELAHEAGSLMCEARRAIEEFSSGPGIRLAGLDCVPGLPEEWEALHVQLVARVKECVEPAVERFSQRLGSFAKRCTTNVWPCADRPAREE